MRFRRIPTAIVLLSLAVTGGAAAQGLGDAAARERARRDKEAKKRGAAKVFTNEDLSQGQPPGTRPQGEGATSSSSSSSSPPPPATEGGRPEETRTDEPSREEESGAAEKPFLEAVSAAQSRLAGLEGRIQELQSKLNPMSGSFIYGAGGSNSAAEEAEVRAELSRAEGDLTAARQDLATAVQAVQDFRQGRTTTPPVPR